MPTSLSFHCRTLSDLFWISWLGTYIESNLHISKEWLSDDPDIRKSVAFINAHTWSSLSASKSCSNTHPWLNHNADTVSAACCHSSKWEPSSRCESVLVSFPFQYLDIPLFELEVNFWRIEAWICVELVIWRRQLPATWDWRVEWPRC